MRNGKRLTWVWEESARPDPGTRDRTGVPDVIVADRSTIEQCVVVARTCLERTGRAILSRVGQGLEARLREEFAGTAEMERGDGCGCVVLRAKAGGVAARDGHPRRTGGRVGVLTAGAPAACAAAEAATVAREMGCEVFTANDLDAAGTDRLVAPLRAMLEERDPDVLVVASGHEDALPSVVAGLLPVPVVGLPTSTGSGHGGSGAALSAMLQSGAPGLCVVGIDDGVGAGAVAGLIANRAAASRATASPPREPARPRAASAPRPRTRGPAPRR
jgi:pyridinium-3,5-biscarboxylic acid mononucleotide synthase